MATIMTEQDTNTDLLATFEIRGTQFAMDAQHVLEVVRLGPITTVSHSMAEVAGILNLRGRIVTILDTGLKLGLGASSRALTSRVFIVEQQGEFIGLLVDSAGDVVELSSTGLEPAPANVSRIQAKFIKGVIRAGAKVITVVDANLLVTDIAD